MQPGSPMRHDVMSVETLSLLHNLMIAATLSTAATWAAQARSNGSIEQFAAQIGESICAIQAQIATAARTKAVVISWRKFRMFRGRRAQPPPTHGTL